MSSINNLSQYVYIENLPFRWVCMWYMDMFVLNESMCIQEMFSFPLTTQTHGPTHTLGYFIHNSDPSKTLLNPFTSFKGVCMCMWFLSFHMFFCRNRCMYWKHTLFLCLFFWLSQLLHQLCHWAPKSAVVDDRSCKQLSIQYLGISVSFKQFHANLIGPKHFVRTASSYYDLSLFVPGCKHVHCYALWKLSTFHKPSLIHVIGFLFSTTTSTR